MPLNVCVISLSARHPGVSVVLQLIFGWSLVQLKCDTRCVCVCTLDKKETLAAELMWVIVQSLWLLSSLAAVCLTLCFTCARTLILPPHTSFRLAVLRVCVENLVHVIQSSSRQTNHFHFSYIIFIIFEIYCCLHLCSFPIFAGTLQTVLLPPVDQCKSVVWVCIGLPACASRHALLNSSGDLKGLSDTATECIIKAADTAGKHRLENIPAGWCWYSFL